jgi:hypothetical protein
MLNCRPKLSFWWARNCAMHMKTAETGRIQWPKSLQMDWKLTTQIIGNRLRFLWKGIWHFWRTISIGPFLCHNCSLFRNHPDVLVSVWLVCELNKKYFI